MIGGVIAAAVVLVGAAIGTTLALSNNSPQGPTYSAQAARYIASVLTDNKKIDDLVALLKPGGSTSGVTHADDLDSERHPERPAEHRRSQGNFDIGPLASHQG